MAHYEKDISKGIAESGAQVIKRRREILTGRYMHPALLELCDIGNQGTYQAIFTPLIIGMIVGIGGSRGT